MTTLPPLTDAAIRPSLRSLLLSTHADERNTVVLEELGLCRGRVRVDLAVVNGLLHGYEIKSDRDGLRRLDVQVEMYSKVLDRATLVVGDRHLADAQEVLPGWWGVVRIKTTRCGPRFSTVRQARRNPARDPRALVELLWLEDALALLERHQMARGARGKPRRMIWDRICKHLGVDEIAEAVRTQLKSRGVRPDLPSQS